MKRILTSLLLTLSCLAMSAQTSNDFNIWANVTAKKNLSERWELMGRVEARSMNTCHDANRVIFRVMPTYKICNWLKVGVGADYIVNWTGPSSVYTPGSIARGMIDFTENFGFHGFQFSIRERYMYAYDAAKNSHSHVVRGKVTVVYPIAGTRFSPYVAGEVFLWDGINQTRAFAGTKFRICDCLSFDLAYLCQMQIKSSFCNHVAKAALNYSF